MAFDTVPLTATLGAQHFEAHVSDLDLDDFKHLLRLSKIGPKTYENQKVDRYFGISRDWLVGAKKFGVEDMRRGQGILRRWRGRR